MLNLTRFILALLCVTVVVNGASFFVSDGVKVDCEQFTLPFCTRNYEPVCGTDGVTYSNECMLCFENSMRKVNVLIKKNQEC